MITCKTGHETCVKIFIQTGIDTSLQCKRNKTAENDSAQGPIRQILQSEEREKHPILYFMLSTKRK